MTTDSLGTTHTTDQAPIAAVHSNGAGLWVVDDDPSIRFVLERALAREQIAARSFANAADVLSAIKAGDKPRVLVSDIRMPGTSGVELLAKVKETMPTLPVIVMTAYSDLDSAVAAFQGGAFEYLPKPFDVTRAVDLIRRAMEESAREAASTESAMVMPELLGQAPAMQEVFRAIGRLSQSQVTVLITGESGTGKELIAQALHRHSQRAAGPFVAINTAAIPKDLLESELFGHERGAFTGAQTLRRGRFEQAEGGTLFLDEIGDMPLELQTRLLRVLSDGQFYRVGGHQPLRASVRVIAATHQNLEQRVRDGAFREDLFHRLNVIRLRVPPLRERPEDVPLLARYFMARAAKSLSMDGKRLSDETLALVARMPFPGNVRQLENLCHWLTVMAPSAVIEPKDLPADVMGQEVATPTGVGSLGHATQSAVGASSVAGAAGVAMAATSPARSDGGAVSYAVGAEHGTLAASQGAGAPASWIEGLAQDAKARLEAGDTDVWDALTRQFEAKLILTALATTRGRRIEAAHRLGIGRNTITRKIQDLGIED